MCVDPNVGPIVSSLNPFLPFISAIIALFAVVFGPVVTLFLADRQITANRNLAAEQISQARRTSNKQAVGPMRQGWINSLRERIAALVASSGGIVALREVGDDVNDVLVKVVSLNQTYNEILLMLNPQKSDHAVLEQTIDKLMTLIRNPASDFAEVQRAGYAITFAARAVLKREWDRIKTDDAN